MLPIYRSYSWQPLCPLGVAHLDLQFSFLTYFNGNPASFSRIQNFSFHLPCLCIFLLFCSQRCLLLSVLHFLGSWLAAFPVSVLPGFKWLPRFTMCVCIWTCQRLTHVNVNKHAAKTNKQTKRTKKKNIIQANKQKLFQVSEFVLPFPRAPKGFWRNLRADPSLQRLNRRWGWKEFFFTPLILQQFLCKRLLLYCLSGSVSKLQDHLFCNNRTVNFDFKNCM